MKVGQANGLIVKFIDARRANDRAAQAGKIAVADIIDQDDDHVRPVCGERVLSQRAESAAPTICDKPISSASCMNAVEIIDGRLDQDIHLEIKRPADGLGIKGGDASVVGMIATSNVFC